MLLEASALHPLDKSHNHTNHTDSKQSQQQLDFIRAVPDMANHGHLFIRPIKQVAARVLSMSHHALCFCFQ